MTDLEKTMDQTKDIDSTPESNNDDGLNFDLSMQEDNQELNDFQNPFGEINKTDSLNQEISQEHNSLDTQEHNESEIDLNGGETDDLNLNENSFIGDSGNNSPKDESSEESSISDVNLKNDDNKGLENSLSKESDEGIILGKFEDKVTNTDSDNKNEISTGLNTELLEQHTALEGNNSNSSIFSENIQDHGEQKLTQKEKLVQLIKIHESKAQKAGFTKGVLSGFLLTLGIVVVSFIFAKDQIIDALGNFDNSSTMANITNLTDKDKINNNLDSNGNVGDDETFNDDEILDTEISNDDEILDTEISNDDEILDTEISNDDLYSIKYVNSEKDANWVLPNHCKDLTCYGENKDFTPCTKFKMVETLDENANRIGSNGACRYKDLSELVYVEFN